MFEQNINMESLDPANLMRSNKSAFLPQFLSGYVDYLHNGNLTPDNEYLQLLFSLKLSNGFYRTAI